MLLLLESVLDAADLALVGRELAQCHWRDGARTAGSAARHAKRNEQADHSRDSVRALGEFVTRALDRRDDFQIAARPKRLSPILFNRYRDGDHYDAHVDNAIMGGEAGGQMRSDLAFTLFLSPPEACSGGELVIEETAGEKRVKLPAGSAVLYPATYLHRVEPVNSGERLAAIGWVQSFIRSAEQREVLWDLEQARLAMAQNGVATLRIDRAIANLLRLWAEL